MDWESVDWKSLARLRELYLNPSRQTGDYWESRALLENYDFTFAARIGWKWDAVLDELVFREWRPGGGQILDWGCGSGVASRAVLGRFGVGPFTELRFWDRSKRAVEFAVESSEKYFGALPCRVEADIANARPDLLLLSHLLNELDTAELDSLVGLVGRAKAVIWVEAGTSAVSRKLSGLRDQLRESFQIVGPCTHMEGCGMFAAGNERHWCHSFARAPSEIFSDSNWVRFGKTMGIDLRSLPYSYLALDQKREAADDLSRVIGEARHYKGYAKALTCDRQHGVGEFILQKRDAPELLKKLKDLREPPFFRFERSEGKIKG